MAVIISDAGGAWNTNGAWAAGVQPTANDDVVASATSGQLTISAGGAVCKSLDFTNYTNTFTHGAFNLTIGNATGGSLRFVSGMTYTPAASTSCKITLISTAGDCDIITAGKTIRNLTINSAASACTYTLQDNLAVTTTLLLTAGIIESNDKNISASTISFPAGVFYAESGTHTFVSWAGNAASTFIPGTSTIVITGGGTLLADPLSPFNNLTLQGSVAVVMDFEVDGTFTISPNAVITFTAGKTATLLGTIVMSGTSGHLITLLSLTPGSQFFIVGAGSSTYNLSYLSITDSNTSNGTFNASNSTNGGDNTGWNFITNAVNKTNNITASITTLTTIPAPTVQTGTFSSAANGIEVTGVGTTFTNLNKGDWLVDYTNYEVRKIANIYNNLYLTLESGFSNVKSGTALVTVPSSRVVRIDLVTAGTGKINNVTIPVNQEIVFDKSSRQDQHSPIDYIDPIFVEASSGTVFAITQY